MKCTGIAASWCPEHGDCSCPCVTRELVGEVHDGDCPDLDEALRAAGWDKP